MKSLKDFFGEKNVLLLILIAFSIAIISALPAGYERTENGAKNITVAGTQAGKIMVQDNSNEFMSVWDNGDGTRSARISSYPINYYDDGNLTPIDRSIEGIDRSIEGIDIMLDNESYEYSSTKNIYRSYFKGSFLSSNTIRYETSSYWIKLTPLDIHGSEVKIVKQDSRITINGSRATYQDAYKGIDVAYDIEKFGLKEIITIKKRPADDVLLIPVLLNYSKGLSTVQENGRVSFRNKTQEVFYLPRPFIDYADGKRKYFDYRLEKDKISMFLPEELLNGSYPIQIDPSISVNMTNPYLEDALVDQNTPTTPYGDTFALRIEKDSIGNTLNQRSYIRWNISERIAREAEEITSGLFEFEKSTTQTPYFIAAGVHEIFRGNLMWPESSITWNNQVCGTTRGFNASCNGTALTSGTFGGAAGQRINFTVTRLVNDSLLQRDAEFGVFSFVLNATADTSDNTAFDFESSETGDEGDEPQLYLTYTINPPRVNLTSPTFQSSSQNTSYIYVNVSVTDSSAGHNTSGFIDITNETGRYSLKGYWSFDNTSADNSTYGHNITNLVANCSSSIQGKFGGACEFNGSQFIRINRTSELETRKKAANEWTMMAWFYVYSTTQSAIISQFNNSPAAFSGMMIFYQSDGDMNCYVNGANRAVIPVAKITLNQWQHVACTWNGTRVKAYLNGTHVATSAEYTAVPDTDNNILIGAYANNDVGANPGNNFIGMIDEAYIYYRTLTHEEINATARSGPLFRNFTSIYPVYTGLASGKYSFYACSTDEGGAKNCTETRLVNLSEPHTTNITLPAGNSTNISYGGSVNKDFTVQCDVQNRYRASTGTYIVIEHNATGNGTWQLLSDAGSDPATFLTVPAANPASFYCGDVAADGSCTNSWTVSGQNTQENIGLRCRSNSTSGGGDDSVSDRTPAVNVRKGTLNVTWNIPAQPVTDVLQGYRQELNATLKCLNYFCGGVNWTARTDDSGGAPSALINSTTQVQLYAGINNFSCGFLDVNQSCYNNITINMTVGSYLGITRFADIIGVSNNTNITTLKNIRTLVGINGWRFLLASSSNGNVYDRGEQVTVSVLLTDSSGRLVSNATVNITAFYPNNSVFTSLPAREFTYGRYNVTFSLSDSQPLGPYHVAVNVTSGQQLAFTDGVFIVTPKLLQDQNATLYNISANIISLNMTLLNSSNFGKYSLQNIINELASARSALESLLNMQHDMSQEEIFLVTDSIVSINEITNSLQNGGITPEEAEKKLELIKKSSGKITGKTAAASPIVPAIDLMLASASLAGTSLMIMARKRKMKSSGKAKSTKTGKTKPSDFLFPQINLLATSAMNSAAGARQKFLHPHHKARHNISLFICKKRLKKKAGELKKQLKSNYLSFSSGALTIDEYAAKKSRLLEALKKLEGGKDAA